MHTQYFFYFRSINHPWFVKLHKGHACAYAEPYPLHVIYVVVFVRYEAFKTLWWSFFRKFWASFCFTKGCKEATDNWRVCWSKPYL